MLLQRLLLPTLLRWLLPLPLPLQKRLLLVGHRQTRLLILPLPLLLLLGFSTTQLLAAAWCASVLFMRGKQAG